MKVELLDEAVRDLLDGWEFYDQRERGLGAYFIDSLYADLRSLVIHGGVHAKVFGYHRMLARRFPFAIYYRVLRKTAKVYAVLDCRRDPAWIRQRLE